MESKMISSAFQGLKRRFSTDQAPLDSYEGLMPDSSGQLGGSPGRIPTMSSSLQDMTFNFSADKSAPGSIDSMTMVTVPSGGGRLQRRRASMQDALDHTKINASLYDTMQSFHQSFGSLQEENLGSLNLSVVYKAEEAMLSVRLIQAQELQAPHHTSAINPYCKLTLLPNRNTVLQSRLHKHTRSPEFEEEFIFEVLPKDMGGRVLELLLYHSGDEPRDACLGQIQLELDELDLSSQTLLWKGISAYTQPQAQREIGDVMFSLSYLPSAERLTVVIQKARNLQPPEEGKNTANPLVKVSLLHGGKRIKKKKTSTKRNTLDPVWNEALVFSCSKDMLDTTQLEVIISNDNLLGQNSALGKTVLGVEATKEERVHWNDMVHAKNSSARWHHLTPP